MNRYPLQPRPQRWNARLNPTVIRLFRSLRRRKAVNEQRLVEVEVRGAEVVRAAIEGGRGVMITPNHPGHADAYAMFEAADRVGCPFYFMSAWQVFALQGALGRWLLTRHGCFSVDREGADREAFRAAVEVVRERREPLVVFPEGEVYHQNDRVTPFREGAAAMALAAARKAQREIAVVPCAIKYRYVDDPTPGLAELMGRLEEKVLWRRRPDLPLAQRVYRFAEGLLALKEIEYLGETREGTIAQRRLVLADFILSGIEERYGLRERGERRRERGESGEDRGEDREDASVGALLPVRVKEARAGCLRRLAELEGEENREAAVRQAHDPGTSGVGGEEDREAAVRQAHDPGTSGGGSVDQQQIACDLDDLFLVVQAFSYPGDYVDERPSVERLAETLDKFEEDVLGVETATVRARRRAVVVFGEAVTLGERVESREERGGALRERVESREERGGKGANREAAVRRAHGQETSGGRMGAGELTAVLEGRVQGLLDEI